MKKDLLFFICIMNCLALCSQSKTFTVSKDGTGDYTTVHEALNGIPGNNKIKTTIFIKNGVYKEKLRLDSSKDFITLVGEDKYKTILTYDDHSGKVTPGGETINTRTSASFKVEANDFKAENITFQNDAGFTAGQAVGLEVQGDRAFIENCRIIGNQDILFTSGDNSRQYYKNCYIEGTTDFIFGSATVWFEQCHIHSKKNSHITAASTPKEHTSGYVFNDCILTGDSTLRNVSLGRPWQPYGSVTYIHCYIDKHVKPEGWANWNVTDHYKTARYAEYENFGPGANKAGRVSWSKQLSENEVRTITREKVFGNWNPDIENVAYDFVVAKDGSGNFKTIQEAINAVPDFRKKKTTIYIKNGIYKEKLVLAESKSLVTFMGENVDSAIITYDDYNQKKNIFGEDKGTSGSSGFYIYGPDFSAENITFSNTAGPVGQAVAVLVAGDKARFKNCRFLGFQDTLYTYGRESRQYYNHCYIEGTVDFIFGSSTAVFDSCIIFGKRGGFYTAASTPENKKYGYVFLNCNITGDASANSFYLGRPWRPFAKTVFIKCYLDKQVVAEGWDNWSNAANEKTTYYAEYKNSGPGVATGKRVAWSHQLTDEEVKQYTLKNILSDWNPFE